MILVAVDRLLVAVVCWIISGVIVVVIVVSLVLILILALILVLRMLLLLLLLLLGIALQVLVRLTHCGASNWIFAADGGERKSWPV